MLTKEEILSLSPRSCAKKRLLSKYRVSDKGCWEYTSGKDRCGYGKFSLGPRRLGAHKVSYVLHKGDVPEGLVVMHSCDNPGCINPDHLSLGTVKDNVHDCINKGRFSLPLAGSREIYPTFVGPRKPRNPKAFKKKRRIIVGRNDHEMVVFTDVYALKAAGFSDGTVSYCVRGIRKSHKGFEWSYIERT